MLFTAFYGSPDDQPIVFLHGFLGSHEDFLPIIEDLKENFFCIAIDLPGHGNSPYTKDILNCVEESLKPLKRPILVGYSMGGRIALQLSQKLSLQAIIILSSHIGLKSYREKEIRLENDRIWQKRLEAMSSEEFLDLWYKQPVFSCLQKNTPLLSSILSQRAYKNPSELALILEEMSLSYQPYLDTFPCPSYFLFGKEDQCYARLYESLSQNIEREGIPNAGHALLIEDPKTCVKLIQKWIEKISCK